MLSVMLTSECPNISQSVLGSQPSLTQFVAKVGNDYYYRVYAIGTPGQSTGVYTTLPGTAPVKHCAVTIAEELS